MSYTRAVLGLTATAIALAGCGHSTASTPLGFGRVPLVRGVQIVAQARQCDRGANPFCAVELVVADHGVRSSGALVTLEGRLLRGAGWSKVGGDSGTESGADSPDQKLHLSYGTSLADLIGSGAGWFKRSRAIALALSRELLAQVPAMALTLEAGPA